MEQAYRNSKWQGVLLDNGETKEMPSDDQLSKLIEKIHVKMEHRGIEATYYAAKKDWGWPGMKDTISGVIKRCNVCQINNRKNTGGKKSLEHQGH